MCIKIFGLCLLLMSTHAIANERPPTLGDNIALGAQLFDDICATCHEGDGEGSAGLYPSLHNPELLNNQVLLIKTVLEGRSQLDAATQKPAHLMPSLNFLTNREIVALIAFITNSWGNQVLVVSEKEVELARSDSSGTDGEANVSLP